MKNKNIKSNNLSTMLKFIIPSILGVLLFMTPVSINGNLTIPIAIFSKFLQDLLGNNLPLLCTILICLSGLLTLLTKILKPKFIINNTYLNNLFNVNILWSSLRIIGSIFALISYRKTHFEFIYSENTGGMLLYSLLPVLFCVFLFAGLLLPLILDFGLLEFVGTLLTKIMRPIFKLPGRSAIDCITSWLGDGTIGVLLTSKQYEQKFYTKREAAIIGTNFSVVSITFCLVIIAQVNLEHMFLPFYLTVTLIGIIAAIITPRIPPLSRIKNVYIDDSNIQKTETIPEGEKLLPFALKNAMVKAENSSGVVPFFTDGIKNVLDMWIGVLPTVMSMGAIALILAEYTKLFQILGVPFIPLLNLLQVPEAAQASQTLVIGFADMFLPSVLATTIKSEMTRFIIACISVTQLIYMSEVGGLLLGSKIPVKFKDLFIIFIERTLITLPLASLIAHILF